jgi:hypothetical protein
MTLKTLVLRGVSVVRDGMASLTRHGQGYQRVQQAPVPFSQRHPSFRTPRLVTDPEPRRLADKDECATTRAGRPGCGAGVSVRRSLALAGASRRIALPALREGGASLLAAGRIGPQMAEALATKGQANPGCTLTAAAPNLRTADSLSWRARSQGGERRAGLLDVARAGGSSTASTRGKGVQ